MGLLEPTLPSRAPQESAPRPGWTVAKALPLESPQSPPYLSPLLPDLQPLLTLRSHFLLTPLSSSVTVLYFLEPFLRRGERKKKGGNKVAGQGGRSLLL